MHLIEMLIKEKKLVSWSRLWQEAESLKWILVKLSRINHQTERFWSFVFWSIKLWSTIFWSSVFRSFVPDPYTLFYPVYQTVLFLIFVFFLVQGQVPCSRRSDVPGPCNVVRLRHRGPSVQGWQDQLVGRGLWIWHVLHQACRTSRTSSRCCWQKSGKNYIFNINVGN